MCVGDGCRLSRGRVTDTGGMVGLGFAAAVGCDRTTEQVAKERSSIILALYFQGSSIIDR